MGAGKWSAMYYRNIAAFLLFKLDEGRGSEKIDYMTPRIDPECVRKKKKNPCQAEASGKVLFQIKNGKKNHHNGKFNAVKKSIIHLCSD